MHMGVAMTCLVKAWVQGVHAHGITEHVHLYILLSVAVMQGQDGQTEGSRYNAGYGASSSSAGAARYVHASSVHEARLLPPHPASLPPVLILHSDWRLLA